MRKALVLVLLSLACGKQTFLAAAFVQTPAVPNPTDPSQSLPQFQVMTAYFGTIDTTDPTKIDANKIAAVTDATASVTFKDLWLKSNWQQNNGTYTLTSKDEPKLTFEPGVPYTLVLQTPGPDGDAYGARFTPGPSEDIVEFKSSTCTVTVGPVNTTAPRCRDGAVGQDLTLTRDLAAGAEVLPAFVVVGQVDPNNPSAEPRITYKTIPDNAADLLKYVLSDQPYRVTSFKIPGAKAFDKPGYFLVTLLIVKQGKVSGNAFPGSTAIAGTGSAGIVRVQ